MVHNGSSGGARALSSGSHAYFEELCAVATTGSLTEEESRLLEEHLAGCAACRNIKEEYDQVVSEVVPTLAAEWERKTPTEGTNDWSVDQAEAALFARLEREPVPRSEPSLEIVDHRSKVVWWRYAAALLAVMTLAFAAYRLGVHHRNAMDTATSIPVATTTTTPAANLQRADSELKENILLKDQIADLRQQLRRRVGEIEQLRTQESSLTASLHQQQADFTTAMQANSGLEQRIAQKQNEVERLQTSLAAAETAKSVAMADSLVSVAEDTETRKVLDDRTRQFAEDQKLLAHDRDIRDLMGARDLYIAEVYDVNKTGETAKPFGRVFYTKGKSLVFYAYDLDQQPKLKGNDTFQAWGRRDLDAKKDVSLGIFYQDDANKKRWVLKFNDPKMLAQINAVFVTVEPHGKSKTPTGKPLLFTDLRIRPNHP